MYRLWCAILVVLCAMFVIAEGDGPLDRKVDEVQAEVEAHLAKLRDQGEPITFEDLAPEPVTPEENAATIYRKALKVCVPRERNAYGNPITPEDEPELSRWLAQNQEALELLPQAAALDRCVFITEYTGIDQGLPHLAMMQEFAVLLGVSITRHVREGRIEKAVDEFLLQLRLAEHLDQGPSLIGHLVHDDSIRMAVQSYATILEHAGAWQLKPEDIVGSVQRMLRGQPAARALAVERVMMFDTLNRPETWAGEEQAKALKAHGTLRLWHEREKLGYLQAMDEIIALSKMPWHEIPEDERDENRLFARLIEQQLPLAAMTIPAMMHFLREDINRQARLRMVLVGIELQEYHWGPDYYPASLADMKLEYLDRLPVDPWTGRPFRYTYTRKREGYHLYSVGCDGKDGGGRPRPWEYLDGYDKVTESYYRIDDVSLRVGGEEERPPEGTTAQ